jgi:hypothetical protein
MLNDEAEDDVDDLFDIIKNLNDFEQEGAVDIIDTGSDPEKKILNGGKSHSRKLSSGFGGEHSDSSKSLSEEEK